MYATPQLSRFGLFDARVPRYTSYPTTPHFDESVGPDDFAEWISRVPGGGEISLYVHIPFCRRLCWFCACRTQGTSTAEPVAAYIETLKSEIGLLSGKLAAGVTLSRLHWGGGTPTLLTPSQIAYLAGATLQVVPLSPGAEFSVEIDPNEIGEARLDALTAVGMNRVSIGVQDFDPVIQRSIGREQSYEITRKVAVQARARGIRSLNADILYGLPHQTRARIEDSAGKLLTLAPDRIALYGYAHVPWMSRRQSLIPAETLPRPEARLSLFAAAREMFLAAGYDEIGIDHFARPGDGLAEARRNGRLRRNFQGYTDDTAPVLIGLGASAISRFPEGYAQNVTATSGYTGKIRAGGFATARGHRLTPDDRLRGRMIEALMCDFRIDAAEIAGSHETDEPTLQRIFLAAAKRFPGMVNIDSGGFEIREPARPLTRMIARAFDAYDQSQAGHSPAV